MQRMLRIKSTCELFFLFFSKTKMIVEFRAALMRLSVPPV